MSALEKLKDNWFLIAIVFAIILANIAPDIGAKGGKYPVILFTVWDVELEPGEVSGLAF